MEEQPEETVPECPSAAYLKRPSAEAGQFVTSCSHAYWRGEEAASEGLQGRQLNTSTKFRLLHLTTGRYLCVKPLDDVAQQRASSRPADAQNGAGDLDRLAGDLDKLANGAVTNVVNLTNEAVMYEALGKIPGITYLSVGHRPSLLRFHAQRLKLFGMESSPSSTVEAVDDAAPVESLEASLVL